MWRGNPLRNQEAYVLQAPKILQYILRNLGKKYCRLKGKEHKEHTHKTTTIAGTQINI